MLKLCLILVVFVHSVFSQAFITEPNESKDHPGNCYFESMNKTFAPGESFVDGCIEYTCNTDFSVEGDGWVWFYWFYVFVWNIHFDDYFYLKDVV